MYEVTREFTGGALKGQTHTEITSVVFTVGQVVSRPIGGSPYQVIRVTEMESIQDGRDQDGGCPWCGRDCPDAGKPQGCWYPDCPDFPHGE